MNAFTRREFLKASGAGMLVVSFSMGVKPAAASYGLLPPKSVAKDTVKFENLESHSKTFDSRRFSQQDEGATAKNSIFYDYSSDYLTANVKGLSLQGNKTRMK